MSTSSSAAWPPSRAGHDRRAHQEPLAHPGRRTSLPGRTFCEQRHAHVGVQCRSQPVDLVPGNAAAATFEVDVDVDVVPSDDGGWDFRGPYVHGRRGERFIYLTWGEHPPDGDFTMFRRAKLHLSGLDPALITAATTSSRALVARLGLTGARGGPRCASVRPPDIAWTTERTASSERS